MNTDKINAIEQNLKKYSQMNNDEILHELDTSENGLSCIIIEEKQEKYGKNIIDINNNNTTFKRLKEAFINPFNIVLIIVAIVTFFTDVVFATNKDYLTFTLIISTVFISAMISFFQQTNSNKAAQKLKKLITNKIDVIRDELPNTVDVEDIVPGDILKLSSGDMIPGDVRFLETKDLFIDQASLKGESKRRRINTFI